MIQRLATSAIAATSLFGCAALLGCTASEGEPVVPAAPAVAPSSASSYVLDLIDQGDVDRYDLVGLVPVGRRVNVVVTLTSLGESVVVLLEATVLRAGADGEVQLIELVVTGVNADDASTVDVLSPIVGSSTSLIRDERLAIVEQQLEVQEGLAFRADAVVRQALRAPFALVGPLPLEPVGTGASWTIETSEDGAVIDTTTVEVVRSSSEGFQLRFDVPDGVVEISGRAGALLPRQQIIMLDNASLTITAERSN